uniref:RanBP2-type domain-containing protein n=1 Tax=Globodera rostochiensis TaxID=31243 RepID=A0A914I632_GLORO
MPKFSKYPKIQRHFVPLQCPQFIEFFRFFPSPTSFFEHLPSDRPIVPPRRTPNANDAGGISLCAQFFDVHQIVCSFRNFMERSSCRRCGHSPPKASLVSAALNVWQCSGCNVMNYNDRAACFKCGIAKPAEIHSLRGEIEADGCWFCAKCGFRNKPIRDACYRCETKPTDEQQHDIIERSGIWLCSSCGNKNFRSKKECNACKMVRGSSIGIYGQSVRK